MHEQAAYFGPDNGLLGIYSTPTELRADAPGVILLNAGLLHRVGPNRLYVDIARHLSARGYPCLRFDMSGVGDSELRGGGLLYVERAVEDVIEAMDDMSDRLGCREFVLVGLCTGAFNAFRAAVRDDRVGGAVLLDGYSYPTWRSRIRHYRSRIFELDRWLAYLRRRLGIGGNDGEPLRDDLVVFENEVVPRDRFGAELKGLIERDARLLMVYTRLGPLAFNYARQMHDAFPELDFERGVDVVYYPDADHTFTFPGNRDALITELAEWVSRYFPVAEPRRLERNP